MSAIFMDPLPPNTGVIFMEPVTGRDGVIYMDQETPAGSTAPFVYLGTYQFSLLQSILVTEWVSAPGITSNCARVIGLPANTIEVKIVPHGGYQIGFNGVPIGYCVGIEFKTDIGFLRMMKDGNNNRVPDQFATSAEATIYWMGLGEQIIMVGPSKLLGWGCGDSILTDNDSPAISFRVFTR
jgi:hypothetical protein